MKNQKSIADKLLNYGIMINNAITDTDIAEAILNYGYSEEVMSKSKNLLQEVDALVKKQMSEYGQQFDATDSVINLWEVANHSYNKTLLIARIAFKSNVEAQTALQLHGNRKRSLSGWLLQAQALYVNLMPNDEFMLLMAKYGYTAEKIASEKTLVDQLEEAKLNQAKEKGEAQQSTFDRDEKMDELDEWISEFRVIVKIALEDKAQWLEKLGILERS